MDNDKMPEPVGEVYQGTATAPRAWLSKALPTGTKLYSAETVQALQAEVKRLRASIGVIHCMAGRVAASAISSECEHAVPALAAMKEQGR